MQTTQVYKIVHILNNSSIIVSSYLTEQILMGKGIGFGKKPGDTLPLGFKYDKSYQLLDKANEFQRIINGYDEQIVIMVMDTIEHIMKHNPDEFTTDDLVTIADHLASMFLRVSMGEAVISFFSQETKTLYPDSYEKAEFIANNIYEKYQVYIPEAEIAYIALYIQNLTNAKSRQEVEQLNSIIASIHDLLDDKENLNIDKDSIAYSRFLIHIHMLIGSSNFKKAPLKSAINAAILESYPQYTELSYQILKIIEEESNRPQNEAEVTYLVIHLINLFEPS